MLGEEGDHLTEDQWVCAYYVTKKLQEHGWSHPCWARRRESGLGMPHELVGLVVGTQECLRLTSRLWETTLSGQTFSRGGVFFLPTWDPGRNHCVSENQNFVIKIQVRVISLNVNFRGIRREV